MATTDDTDALAGTLRRTVVELVRRDGHDLSARQFGVFLICYLESEAQTVRGLAEALDISKPAISRALDRLSEFDLVKRKIDPQDRRSVLLQRTPPGNAFFREVKAILKIAANPPEPARARPRARAKAAAD